MPTSYTSQIIESGTLRSLCSQLQSAFVRQSCPSFSRQLQISLINIDQKLYSEKISMNIIHWILTCSSRCIASLHGSSGWTVKWLFLPGNPTGVNILIWTRVTMYFTWAEFYSLKLNFSFEMFWNVAPGIRGGQNPQHWNFKDVTKNCGYASPGNHRTPWVGSFSSKLTFCIAFQFLGPKS